MLGAGQLCVLYVPMKVFFFVNFNRKDCHQIKCNIKIITQSIKRRSLNSTANTKGGTDGQTWRNLKKQISRNRSGSFHLHCVFPGFFRPMYFALTHPKRTSAGNRIRKVRVVSRFLYEPQIERSDFSIINLSGFSVTFLWKKKGSNALFKVSVPLTSCQW